MPRFRGRTSHGSRCGRFCFPVEPTGRLIPVTGTGPHAVDQALALVAPGCAAAYCSQCRVVTEYRLADGVRCAWVGEQAEAA
jgi:hypothetical protein